MFRFVLIGVAFLSLTTSAQAAVSISEIAWMGGVSSANHEWIELHNDGAATDLTGWVLSDELNLSITLTGTIDAGAYGVLERTSDASAPGVALLIYSGALVNTGTTLTLRDQNGNTVDRVVGGENWELIGGDNVTKDTAQYTSSGWVTDMPTPGAPNNPGRTEAVDDATPAPSKNSSSGTSRGSAQSTRGTMRAEIPRSAITLSTTIPEIAFVGQVTYFDVTATWVQPRHQRLVEFIWNFGDGTATSGRTVAHRYEYPGTYVVSVSATRDEHEQVARGTITVLPTEISITVVDEKIHIHNDAVYEVDVSGFMLKGEETFRFPPESIMAPRGTITLARSVIGDTAMSKIALYDRRAAPVAYASTAVQDVTLASASTEAIMSAEAVSLLPTTATTFSFTDEPVLPTAKVLSTTSSASAPLVVSTVPPNDSVPYKNSIWPYGALLVVMVCGIAALLPRRPLAEITLTGSTSSATPPLPFS